MLSNHKLNNFFYKRNHKYKKNKCNNKHFKYYFLFSIYSLVNLVFGATCRHMLGACTVMFNSALSFSSLVDFKSSWGHRSLTYTPWYFHNKQFTYLYLPFFLSICLSEEIISSLRTGDLWVLLLLQTQYIEQSQKQSRHISAFNKYLLNKQMNKCSFHKTFYKCVPHLFQSFSYSWGSWTLSDLSKAIQWVSSFEVELVALFLIANTCY